MVDQARRHLLRVADGARVVDERAADRIERISEAGGHVHQLRHDCGREMLTRDLTDDRGVAGSC
jgi:hypothetical protein